MSEEREAAFEAWKADPRYYQWSTTDEHAALNFEAGWQAARQSAGATPINDDLKATSGPLLELDVLLAKHREAVWNAAADETGKTAYDEAGVAECKAIQRHVRAMLAAGATGQEPIGTVHVQSTFRSGVHEVSEPVLRLSPAFEAKLDAMHDVIVPLYAAPIGDNGAKSSGSAAWDYGNGLVDKKLDPSYAQPAESKRVGLTDEQWRIIQAPTGNPLFDAGVHDACTRISAMLARASAAKEGP